MIRPILFFFVILFYTISLRAQGPVTVDPVTFTMTGHPSQTDISYHIHVTNTTNEPIHIFWSKRMSNQPAQWASWICDKNLCYEPDVNSCPASKPNVVGPNETFDLQVHLNPGQTEGTGNYDLNVIDNNGNTLQTVTGIVNINMSTSVKESGEGRLSVFPNPTFEFFEVSDTPGLRYIEVFNIVGNKVKAFDAAPQKQYFVGDLTDGLYLVRLISASNKVLKTVRLSKR